MNNDPVLEFFLRKQNTKFSSDARLSIFVLILPLIAYALLPSAMHFTMKVLTYFGLSCVCIYLLKYVIKVPFMTVKVSVVFVCFSFGAIGCAILIREALVFDGEMHKIVDGVLVLSAIVINIVGVNMSYNKAYAIGK